MRDGLAVMSLILGNGSVVGNSTGTISTGPLLQERETRGAASQDSREDCYRLAIEEI